MPEAHTEADRQATVDALRATGGHREQAAALLGINERTLRRRILRMDIQDWRTPKPFDVPALPAEVPSAEELLKRRSSAWRQKQQAADARDLIPIAVKCTGPFGIALLGDPHIDDDGTDIDLLQQHVKIINAHEHLFPIGIGDYSNNWVGRLARLYANQTTSAREAWVLVEWLVNSLHWLALVAGNHDVWTQNSGDPIQWMAKAARVMYEAHGVRLGLQAGPRTFRINARHDFAGRSQYNTAHGPAKAVLFGWRDHVAVAGHTHVSGIQILRDPMSGLITHALRIGSYKTHDAYALEKGLPNQTFMVCPVTIIRPRYGDDDNRLLTTFLEPETAAAFLAWLRTRKSE